MLIIGHVDMQAGSLFAMGIIIIGYDGVFNATAHGISTVRGIGANWPVCLVWFLAFMAREYYSKVVAIWWAKFALV